MFDLNLIGFITESDFDNLVAMAVEVDLEMLRNIARESQESIADGPAWSSWS